MNSLCVHPPVVQINVTATATAIRIEICGEVDLSDRNTLIAALAAIDLDAADAVNLDLRQLTFCDSAGCWALLMFERRARLSGHPTNIYGATRTVQRVMTILADSDPPTFV
jgi:ABC-type transporter Mla MlaB component